MPKLLIFDVFTLSIREENVANYALLRCKTLSQKIWLCKFFDKYHVCETPTTARFDNHWLLWSGSTQQLVSGATWLQWAPNEARLEWPSSTISSTPLVAETVGLVWDWETFTRVRLRLALTLVTIRILVPAQRGELRPAHEQVESGRQYVQEERRSWGRLHFILIKNSTCCNLSDIVITVLSFRWGLWTVSSMPSVVTMLLQSQIPSSQGSTAWKGGATKQNIDNVFQLIDNVKYT